MTPYVYRGITLVELMIVIAIVTILLAVAVPNFSNQIITNQIAGYTSDFADSLRRAKTESGARLARVIICIRTTDPDAGDVCDDTNTAGWDNGWFVFLDADNNGAIDADIDIFYRYEGFDQDITFTATDANNNPITAIAFTPFGDTSLTSVATFAICSQDRSITNGILLTVTGHSSPLDFGAISGGDC